MQRAQPVHTSYDRAAHTERCKKYRPAGGFGERPRAMVSGVFPTVENENIRDSEPTPGYVPVEITVVSGGDFLLGGGLIAGFHEHKSTIDKSHRVFISEDIESIISNVVITRM